MKLFIVLVEPKYDGNIGATARAMKNFGFGNLVLINPTEIGTECYKRAMHAEDIVKEAKTFKTLKEFLKDMTLVVGATGILNLNEKAHLRNPISPRELSEKLSESDDSVALLLGREDYGLYKEELAVCDIVVTIPTSKEYPVMNISHAAAVIMYELSLVEFRVQRARGMTQEEKTVFFDMFDRLLKSIDYPDYKYENTRILFKRLIGRAMPTEWEFHVLMGILNRAAEIAETHNDEQAE